MQLYATTNAMQLQNADPKYKGSPRNRTSITCFQSMPATITPTSLDQSSSEMKYFPWTRQDSNLEPHGCKPCALPLAPHAQYDKSLCWESNPDPKLRRLGCFPLHHRACAHSLHWESNPDPKIRNLRCLPLHHRVLFPVCSCTPPPMQCNCKMPIQSTKARRGIEPRRHAPQAWMLPLHQQALIKVVRK